MTILVCVDDRMGQAFHRRRQSRDRVLCARVLELAGTGVLHLSPYSKPLFTGLPGAANLSAGEDYLDRAGPGEVCFVEREELSPWLDRADKLVLFRWNRSYPFDLRFPAAALIEGWRLYHTEEFAGSSHDRITEEWYEKK